MIKTKLFLFAIFLIAYKSLFAQTQVPENSSSPIYYQNGKVGIGVTELNVQLAIKY